MSEIAKQLGQRIRELRNERHMSQEELSFKAGISPAHLGQIERALKNPTIDTVSKIAAALGVPVSTLFTEDSVCVPLQNTTIEKINAQLLSMNEDEQKDVLRIIRIFRGYQRRNPPPSEADYRDAMLWVLRLSITKCKSHNFFH